MVSEGGVPDCHLSPDQKDGSHPSCIITLSFDPVGKRVLILIGIKTLNSDRKT